MTRILPFCALALLLGGCAMQLCGTQSKSVVVFPSVNWRVAIPEHKPCDWYNEKSQYYNDLALSWNDAAPVDSDDFWEYERVHGDYKALADRYQAQWDKCETQ